MLSIPSLCGMFVYRDDTSMDARILLAGSGVPSTSLMNSVESFRYEGSFFTNGWSHLSTNCDMGSVILLQLDTIGLMPIGFLCIFFRKYSLDVRDFSGGLQKSYHVCLIRPFVFRSWSLHKIFCFSAGDMSSLRGLYMEVSFRCDIAFFM